MIRGKRGAFAEPSVMWLVGFAVLFVAFAVIYLGIRYGEKARQGILEPTEAIIQGCGLVANQGAALSFCDQVREIADDYFATCDYLKEYLAQADIDAGAVECDAMLQNNKIKTYCGNEVKPDKRTEVKVNGVLCSAWLADNAASNA